MKKWVSVLSAFALMGASLFFVSCGEEDEINYYATTTVDRINFTTAKAFPGVNVLKWNAVNDVANYTVYRTVKNGHVEEALATNSALYYIDTAIDSETTYTYRVVANPTDSTMHDASEKSVTLNTGTWPEEGTTFSDLASSDGIGGTAISSDNITLKLYPVSTSNTVRVSFPVKPYAQYEVYFGDYWSSTHEASTTIYGFNYSGTATVDLTATSAGTKYVTVVATPLTLGNSLYAESSFTSKESIEIPLSSPTGISLSDYTYTISWNPVSGAERYYIYRATSPNELASGDSDSSFAETTSTSYTVTPSYTTTYYYAVRAYDSGSYSALSDSVTVHPVYATPYIRISSDDNLTIEWSSVTAATQYYIYRATSEEALRALSDTDYFNTTSSTSYIASDSVVYYYAVKAYNGSEYSNFSNVVSIGRNPLEAPSISLDNLTIEWSSVTAATQYYIYRATSEEALRALSDNSYYAYTSETSYTAQKSYVTYYYAVKAYNVSEYSDFSNVVSIESVAVGENDATWTLSPSSGSSYSFAEYSTYVWKSNNQGIDSSEATSTWTITLSADVSSYTIPYTVSSESNYDKLTITLDDTLIVDAISGDQSSSYTNALSAGTHTLTATYTKDNGGANGDDTATITLEPVVIE